MGLVLDSSVLIDAERQQMSVSTLLGVLETEHNATEIVLSAISVVELEHGIYRAQSPEQAAKRGMYLDTSLPLFLPNLLPVKSAGLPRKSMLKSA